MLSVIIKAPFFSTVLAVVLGVCLPLTCAADQITFIIHGVGEPLLTNVQSRVEISRFTTNNRLSERRLKEIQANSERRAALAIQPFGYYQPSISSEFQALGERDWQLELFIDKGPPLLINNTEISVAGEGEFLATLQEWLHDWPLGPGLLLDQSIWEDLKREGLDRAYYEGYLSADYSLHNININLDSNQADLSLKLETGAQSVMGTVTFDQDQVRAGILENLPRFKSGDPYNAWLIERFHFDLWNTGYFESIEIVEQRNTDKQPPSVDFQITLGARNKNTYQGTLGVGTDTGPRLQLQWNRHLISDRGDRFALGVGWQEKNNESSIRANYRLPRRLRAREYWVPEVLIKSENQDLKIKENDDDPDFVSIANGNVEDYSFRFGRLRTHNLRRGVQQLTETFYGQYLSESTSYTLIPTDPDDPNSVDLGLDFANQFAADLSQNDLKSLRSSKSLSFGINVEWPVIRGSGFATVGHHQRMHLFTANKAWGSDRDFTQIYFSSRWNFLAGDRWKFLARAEVGYSDAKVITVNGAIPNSSQELSVTLLPNLYRFKAGGSHSVRGYGFEDLTNNGIGSNHIITASAEVEFMFRQNWSVATFLDIGNAFNDWSDRNLKRGLGAGLRWYSIAGPVRLDFAQALDFDGQPWRVHFTIGIPLL